MYYIKMEVKLKLLLFTQLRDITVHSFTYRSSRTIKLLSTLLIKMSHTTSYPC